MTSLSIIFPPNSPTSRPGFAAAAPESADPARGASEDRDAASSGHQQPAAGKNRPVLLGQILGISQRTWENCWKIAGNDVKNR